MTCSAHSMPSVPPTTAALPELGVAAVEIGLAAELAGFVAAEAAGQLARYPGFHEWTAPDFRVEAGGPIEAGVDGEALVLESPLGVPFSPRRARVRIPTHAPGWSPAALAPPSVCGRSVR